MFESGYYPPGAEHDPNAPYNQSDPDPVEKEVNYSCTMQRAATVETTDYAPGYRERDEDGYAVHEGDDFSDTDWLTEFKEQYRNPAALIEILRETAALLADGKMPDKPAKYWREVATDCEAWEIDEEYAEEI